MLKPYIKDGLITIFKKELKTLDNEDLIDEFVTLTRKGVLKFPFKRYFMTSPETLFSNAENYIPTIGRSASFLFSFVTQPDDYENIDQITDWFQEKQRLSARRKDTSRSILQLWKTPAFSRKIVHHLLENDEAINTFTLREAVYSLGKECTQFKVTLAFSIFDYYKAKRVLDFSAGWGDRLIAAMASPTVKFYLGVDPNTNLRKGHNEMISMIKKRRRTYEILYTPFEKTDIDEKFDLVFTSPPFFDVEIYTAVRGQSIASFPTYERWLKEFLFESIRKAWFTLEESGHMILHLNNKSGNEVKRYMRTFSDSSFIGVIASRGASEIPRPLFVWKKISVSL